MRREAKNAWVRWKTGDKTFGIKPPPRKMVSHLIDPYNAGPINAGLNDTGYSLYRHLRLYISELDLQSTRGKKLKKWGMSSK